MNEILIVNYRENPDATISIELKLAGRNGEEKVGSALIEDCEYIEGGIAPEECLDWLHLTDFYIEPKFKDGHFGTRLLEEVINLAEEKGKPILLSPHPYVHRHLNRTELISLYCKHGFRCYDDASSVKHLFLLYEPKSVNGGSEK